MERDKERNGERERWCKDRNRKTEENKPEGGMCERGKKASSEKAEGSHLNDDINIGHHKIMQMPKTKKL